MMKEKITWGQKFVKWLKKFNKIFSSPGGFLLYWLILSLFFLLTSSYWDDRLMDLKRPDDLVVKIPDMPGIYFPNMIVNPAFDGLESYPFEQALLWQGDSIINYIVEDDNYIEFRIMLWDKDGPDKIRIARKIVSISGFWDVGYYREGNTYYFEVKKFNRKEYCIITFILSFSFALIVTIIIGRIAYNMEMLILYFSRK